MSMPGWVICSHNRIRAVRWPVDEMTISQMHGCGITRFHTIVGSRPQWKMPWLKTLKTTLATSDLQLWKSRYFNANGWHIFVGIAAGKGLQ